MRAFLAYVCAVSALVSLALLLLRPIPMVVAVIAAVVFFVAAKKLWPQRASADTSGNERFYAIIMVLFTVGVCGVLLLLGLPFVFARQPKPLGIYDSHPTYYWTLAPSSEGKREVPLKDGTSIEWTVSISEQGFPDEVVPPKSEGEYRVLLLGDSFAMGWGLEPEERISTLLENELEHAVDREVRVVNGGVVGYAPWQSRGYLQERGFGIEPDLVIAQVFPGNDVEGSLEEVGAHLRAYDADWKRNLNLRIARQQWQVQLQTWVLWNVPGWRTLESMTGNQNMVVDGLNAVRLFKPFELPVYPPSEDRKYYLEPMLAQSYPELDRGWELLGKALTGMRDDCKERDVAFMAFAVPEAAAVVDSLWKAEELDDTLYKRGGDVRRAESVFEAIGINYVPVADEIATAENRESLYFHLDRHFAPDGAVWISGLLAEAIVESGVMNP